MVQIQGIKTSKLVHQLSGFSCHGEGTQEGCIERPLWNRMREGEQSVVWRLLPLHCVCRGRMLFYQDEYGGGFFISSIRNGKYRMTITTTMADYKGVVHVVNVDNDTNHQKATMGETRKGDKVSNDISQEDDVKGATKNESCMLVAMCTTPRGS